MDALTFATGLAREAGLLLRGYYQRADLKTSLKSDRSVVTEADLAADRLIAESVRTAFPGDWLLSEELAPGLQDLESASPEALRPVWVIDPLDGTTNFSLGLYLWGVLITRLVGGQPECTAQYFPLVDELYTARRGQGAWLNGAPLHTRPEDAPGPKAFFTCCSRAHRHYQVNVPYKTRILGSAAYSFCCVARGVALLGFEATPKIWDIAGGWLLVEEAGGIIGTLDSSRPFPLSSTVDYARQSFPTLAAATPALAEQGRVQIRPRGI